MIKLAKDDQYFGRKRAMILFKNPEDVLIAKSFLKPVVFFIQKYKKYIEMQ
ncbi:MULTISPECIES: hypothetical protein [Clostridium]|uniref:Uncharacterized protein n=1 Tax=Clostridium cibarium TaxID=2762247 RepID=A0ABR8PSW6_9CLOT|nr:MULTISPECIES: hypothetical protein [Clostridium]MBD7911242.1 hypothetical protein [Clostridium cibarium]